MIARLIGKIEAIFDDSILINVNGICFQVFVAVNLRDSFVLGGNVNIRISHIFRQEQQYLCGFASDEEMAIFKALLDVPGIGMKSALSVLSTLTIEEFAMAVANQTPDPICRADGVGKKTAERILLELKDKNIAKIKDVCQKGNANINDAILGLVSLGYPKNIVVKIVSEVSSALGPDADTNELIINCLKRL
ncbi:Holliday junction ATP-dependent DNA helicase RuvA [Alphaproteobacteria bacterium]|nr:Holliday junction ATP-dependent DNA helicase RuvA [Alphaproteobacteria bacterium]